MLTTLLIEIFNEIVILQTKMAHPYTHGTLKIIET